MNKSRTTATIKNALISITIQLITLLLMFVQRTFLIKCLTAEYIGLEGLFSNILSLLNMVELGFGSALIFSMYRPMANGDEKKLVILLKLYKKIYITCGTIILLIGLLLTPFLKYLIKDVPSIPEVYFIYILYVINTAVSYFFVYKSSILIVAQEQYIINLNRFVFLIIQIVIQVFVLISFKNYIFYYIVTLICTFLANISISRIADNRFPYIREDVSENLSKEELNEIKDYVSVMFLNKVGWIVLNGTDNILISKFIGIIAVGVYSNYMLLINASLGLIGRVYTALTPSVGNLAATSDSNKAYKVFKDVFFLTNLIATVCTICMLLLMNPLIVLWLGSDFILGPWSVVIIVANFYLAIIRRASFSFDEAYGLLRYCKFKPVYESLANLIFSIILAKMIGFNGVLLGTTVSTLMFTFWIEPYVLYRFVFNISPLKYFILLLKYLFTTLVILSPCLFISRYIIINSFIQLIFSALLYFGLIIALFIILRYKSPEFLYFKTVIKSKVSLNK